MATQASNARGALAYIKATESARHPPASVISSAHSPDRRRVRVTPGPSGGRCRWPANLLLQERFRDLADALRQAATVMMARGRGYQSTGGKWEAIDDRSSST